MFLKSDLKTFSMSYHELNLDAGNASKRDLKVALCVGPVALRVGQFLLRITIFPVFLLCSWIISHGGCLTIVNDDLACNYDR